MDDCGSGGGSGSGCDGNMQRSLLSPILIFRHIPISNVRIHAQQSMKKRTRLIATTVIIIIIIEMKPGVDLLVLAAETVLGISK
ncbi:hypothetical protein TYRP_023253 [Tyrophagus putrescentiae]|nr:hypothetical protein TYRP_023253 [Tyrophagus putrescentiae]